MAYEVRFGKILLPITPSKINTKVNNQNKSYNLIDNGEINILKEQGLKTIDLEIILPNVRYPFSKYDFVFLKADYFLEQFEQMKNKKESFNFVITRRMPDNKLLFDTDIKVSIEDFTINEDSQNGFDIHVSMSLKEFKEYATKIVTEDLSILKDRNSDNSPKPDENISYIVVKGDTLWGLSKYYYGDGAKYMKIANHNNIKNPNSLFIGQTLIIPV